MGWAQDQGGASDTWDGAKWLGSKAWNGPGNAWDWAFGDDPPPPPPGLSAVSLPAAQASNTSANGGAAANGNLRAPAQGDPHRYRGGPHPAPPGGGTRPLTAAEAAVVTADLARTRAEINRTINALNRWNTNNQANFQKWYGTTSPATRAAVLGGFQRMQGQFAGVTAANYQFNSSLPHGVFPGARPADPALMDLGVSYFDDLGPLARAGTLIHESTHLNIIAATNAVSAEVYGSIAARSLAAASPAAALTNAENWNFFATQPK